MNPLFRLSSNEDNYLEIHKNQEILTGQDTALVIYAIFQILMKAP